MFKRIPKNGCFKENNYGSTDITYTYLKLYIESLSFGIQTVKWHFETSMGIFGAEDSS